ncbi:hypothetical protein [Diaminobutyricimonas sp. LJ205]|uniref:hypothetical protein n=1 Tax=Diaminobutyricimonas sp. LJ205 TaxID=2683590 RepID=UPI0012F51BF5|nr:hypothetical protein [Diaminobutyricimonas sp. LJ205]
MVAVIGVMAALAIITVTVTTMTTQAVGITSSSRASVQARAAAEAGIDVATAALKTTNGCVATLASADPTWNATIAYDEGGGWIDGCPTAMATLARVLSTGSAAAEGVAGVSGGDQVTIEAVYKIEPIITQVPVAGSAVYAHEIQGVLKKFELDSADNSVATSVSIKNGDVKCTNGASIGGDLLLGNGNADLDMCDVAGSVYVNGNAVVHKSAIGGVVRATGTALVTQSTVGGTPPILSGGTVPPPSIPDWVDVPGTAAYWASHGYNVVNWTGPCAISKHVAAWANIKDYTTPTVIDFRSACPATMVSTNNNMDTVAINTDIIFISHQFTFDKLYFSATTDRKLTFLVPDDVVGDGPTCAPPGSLNGEIRLTNEANFGTKIAAIVYTPCQIFSDRDGFRGQLYGGEVEFAQQASLTFVPVGIAGVDLTGGATTPVQTGISLGARLSYRDAPVGG